MSETAEAEEIQLENEISSESSDVNNNSVKMKDKSNSMFF